MVNGIVGQVSVKQGFGLVDDRSIKRKVRYQMVWVIRGGIG